MAEKNRQDLTNQSFKDYIDTFKREMAPSRSRYIASRHLVCGTCISWVDFNKSRCTNTCAEMRGGTCVFACKGCRDVARFVGEVATLRHIMEIMKMIVTGQGVEEKGGESGDRVAGLEESEK